jgi:hypothetical protein
MFTPLSRGGTGSNPPPRRRSVGEGMEVRLCDIEYIVPNNKIIKIRKMKKILILLLLVVCNTLNAQVATVPFELYRDNTILLKLPINDRKDTLTFFFDTGATTALLDSATATKIGLVSDYEQNVNGASGSKTYKVVLNQSVRMGNIKIGETHFVLENLSRLQKTLGRKFDGIIGYSILKSYKTKINFDKSEIELYQFTDVADTVGYHKIDFKFNNNITIPQIPITIELNNGKTYTDLAFFDSGAGLTFLMNTPFKEKNNIVQDIGKILVSSSQNLSAKALTQIALIKSLQIGAFKFGENCISLSSDLSGVSSYKNYMGILGADIINRFNIILDYSTKKIFLKPNHLFDNKFVFPVSGIKLKKENDEILISEVIEASEAYRKGLRENQKIISINHHKTLDIETYRKLLKEENTTVKIEYLSESKTSKKIKLRLKRLI